VTDQELEATSYASSAEETDDRVADVVRAWLAGYEAGVAAPRSRPGKKATRVVEVRDPKRLEYYTNEQKRHFSALGYDGPYKKRIGYAKLGRTIDLDPYVWDAAGDNEPPSLLNKLALRHPDVEFVILGRNSGEDPASLGLPRNVTNPWIEWKPEIAARNSGGRAQDRQYAQDTLDEIVGPAWDDLDGIISWAGQHGTSNSRIPTVENPDVLTEPQISFIHYASHIVRGINRWRDADPHGREEVWLCPDARNYIKARDIKWPLTRPVLSQFNWVRPDKLYRYGDFRSPDELEFYNAFEHNGNVWQSPYRYKYSRLELVGLPSEVAYNLDDHADRASFGIIINEARNYVKHDRLTALQDYVLPLDPAFIHGKWTKKSLEAIGRDIEPIHYSTVLDKIRSVKTTFTTPSSGSGWATTKPWEAFAVGTACLFHPEYDTQGHIIPTTRQIEEGKVDHNPDLKSLAQWLRADSPEQLEKRVKQLDNDEDAWKWVVETQRAYFEEAIEEAQCITEIEKRLGI
jgi:hypothetical protein